MDDNASTSGVRREAVSTIFADMKPQDQAAMLAKCTDEEREVLHQATGGGSAIECSEDDGFQVITGGDCGQPVDTQQVAGSVDGASPKAAAIDGGSTEVDGASPKAAAIDGGSTEVDGASPKAAAIDGGSTKVDGASPKAAAIDGGSTEVDGASPKAAAIDGGSTKVNGASPKAAAIDGGSTEVDGASPKAAAIDGGSTEVDGASPKAAAIDGGSTKVDGASPKATASEDAGCPTPPLREVQPQKLFPDANDVPSKDSRPVKNWAFSGVGSYSVTITLLLVVGVLLAVGLLAPPDGDASSRTVCVTSNADGILNWAMNLAVPGESHGAVKPRRLMTVLDEDTKLDANAEKALQPKSTKSNIFWWFPSWFPEARCDQVVVIVRASQLASGRNPLHKYSSRTKTRLLLEHAGSMVAVVNATCEDMVRGISDDRTGRIAECQHSRERTFQEFMAARAPSQLVPPTTKIKDVPLMTNPEEYFRLLFTPEVHESADAFSGRLQARAQKAPVQACSFDNETSRLIRESYPQFQIAVIGKEGAGKSTTARWLAHHLNSPDAITNSFSSASAGASFSRNFNMAELTPTLALADTRGLPELSSKYLCDIKDMLDGTLVRVSGEAMQWTDKETCTTSWLAGRKEERSALTAHALLFLIEFKENGWQEQLDEVKELVSAMKKFVRTESQFDLMDRMVFGITRAPVSRERFRKLVDDMSLPQLDTFAINGAIVTDVVRLSDKSQPEGVGDVASACVAGRCTSRMVDSQETRQGLSEGLPQSVPFSARESTGLIQEVALIRSALGLDQELAIPDVLKQANTRLGLVSDGPLSVQAERVLKALGIEEATSTLHGVGKMEMAEPSTDRNEVYITPETYDAIVKRLQEKACKYFHDKVTNTGPAGRKASSPTASSSWVGSIIIFLFPCLVVVYCSKWAHRHGDGAGAASRQLGARL